MTPYELTLHVSNYNEIMKYNQEEKLVAVWLGAYWNRIDPKKFPKLKEVLGHKEKPKQQTPEEMLELIKKINAANGGTTY